jgi:SAM-dependent methyltransferase
MKCIAKMGPLLPAAKQGGYDSGYEACPCFWGSEPSSLVRRLVEHVGSVSGSRVLDVGCGEGKNAAFLALRGAQVLAVDVSSAGLENGRNTWRDVSGITWLQADITALSFPPQEFDIVVIYGLCHCLDSKETIKTILTKLMESTSNGGYNVVCTFHDRYQELDAHPDLDPCLLPHSFYTDCYSSWDILVSSDADLVETHPHNRLLHTHAMTRILARKLD